MLSEPNDANMKSSDSGGLDCFLNYLSVLHEPSSWHDLLGLIFSEKTGKPAPPSYTCQDLRVSFHTFPYLPLLVDDLLSLCPSSSLVS